MAPLRGAYHVEQVSTPTYSKGRAHDDSFFKSVDFLLDIWRQCPLITSDRICLNAPHQAPNQVGLYAASTYI